MPSDPTTTKFELIAWVLGVLTTLVFLAAMTVALWHWGAPLAGQLFSPPDRPESHRL